MGQNQGTLAMSEPTHTQVAAGDATDSRRHDPMLEHVRQALVGLRYGEISIIVQDGVVVQLERIERRRFRRGER